MPSARSIIPATFVFTPDKHMPEQDDIAKRIAARTAALAEEKRREDQQRQHAADVARSKEEALYLQAKREMDPLIAAITEQMDDAELAYLLGELLIRIKGNKTPAKRYPAIELEKGQYHLKFGRIELDYGFRDDLWIAFISSDVIHVGRGKFGFISSKTSFTLLKLKEKLIDAIATFDVEGRVYLDSVFEIIDDTPWTGM